MTAVVGVAAKILGVAVVPGMRGIASQGTMDVLEVLSGTLAYAFAALLVGILCGGAFEIARRPSIGALSKVALLSAMGAILAVILPAVVRRIPTMAGIVLAGVTSVVAIAASVGRLRAPHTRILGVVLGVFGLAGLCRPAGWVLFAFANERTSMALYSTGRGVLAASVLLQTAATLLATVWIGTRSRVRGRLLANAAVGMAFLLTYIAARDTGGAPSAFEAVLRGSLSHATGMALPFGLTSVHAFLVTATILLAGVTLVQRTAAPTVLATLSLALLSQGTFEVPLQALAISAATLWAVLASSHAPTLWSDLTRRRPT